MQIDGRTEMWTIRTLVGATHFTDTQNVQTSCIEGSDEKSFRS